LRYSNIGGKDTSKSLVGISVLLVLFVFLNAYSSLNLALCNAQEYKENKTGVIITKEIQGDLLNPKLVYYIKTPIIDYFDFVLAVDNSGSVGIEGKGLEGSAISRAVPRFLKGIAENSTRTSNANFNISIISWNDKIDFVSSDFTNIDPTKAKFFSINKSTSTKSVDAFNSKFKDYYNYSDETSGTNISIAIKASKDTLDADKKLNANYFKTKKFIILVTGNGEFKPCAPNLMKAVGPKYEIFTIGLDIPSSSYLFNHLKKLAMNKQYYWKFIGAGESELHEELDKSLEIALRDALDNATKSAVAYNVRIVESLYCYYTPDLASFTVNGSPINKASVRKKDNPDGTTTIDFSVPEGLLKPNSETIVSFDAKFEPRQLPVTLTDVRKPIALCSPDSNTVLPTFHYNWFNGDGFDISLT
jgi:hypothetical protein